MSSNNNEFNPFDPTGVFKGMRDATLDAWAKSMIELVNTDAYAEANARLMDAWLSSSAPFRRAMEAGIAQTLAQLNMPSRDEVARLAERLTNIEMRLDDLEAMLDERLPKKASRSRKSRTGSGENHA
jgi:hypothetical protein